MTALVLIKILQIVFASMVTLLVLIQSKGGGLSSSVGGSISSYRSKRGVERSVFGLTIVFDVALVINSVLLTYLSS